MAELKRCPICGSKNVIFGRTVIGFLPPALYLIICDECRSRFVVRTNDKEQLIKSFNRRSGKNRLTCFSCGSPLTVKSMRSGSFHLICSADQNSSLDACGLEYFVFIPDLSLSSDAYNKEAQELFELYLGDEPSAKWVNVRKGKIRNGKEEKPWWRCCNCMHPAPGYPEQDLTAYCPGCKLRMRVDKDDSEGGGDGEGG